MRIEVKFITNPRGGADITFEAKMSEGYGVLCVVACPDIPEKDMAIAEINRGILAHFEASPKESERLPSASLAITALHVTEPSQKLFGLAGIFVAKEYQRLCSIV